MHTAHRFTVTEIIQMGKKWSASPRAPRSLCRVPIQLVKRDSKTSMIVTQYAGRTKNRVNPNARR